MLIEIKDIHILLPALISFEQDGKKLSLFAYINQSEQDVIIPDPEGIEVEEFKQAFAKYYNLKNVAVKHPKLPKDVMSNLNHKDFRGDYGTQEG